MKITGTIVKAIQSAIELLYQESVADIKLEKTNESFIGDYTFVVFPLLKLSKKNPETTATEIGHELIERNPKLFKEFNVVKGFLNLVVVDSNWIEEFKIPVDFIENNTDTIMVEYSSPNTNKPLHLGHVRNNLLGFSVGKILKKVGHSVVLANLINDRGIHICKSMLAWKLFGNGETPQSSHLKGDHFVGKYYVVFENKLRESTKGIIDNCLLGNFLEIADVGVRDKISKEYSLFSNSEIAEEKRKQAEDNIKELVRNNSNLMKDCQTMLRDWEQGKPETIELWRTMNNWVYSGFETTYKRMGVEFDKFYYESHTYTLGKDIISVGLEKGVFYKKEDGSVWIDLTTEGLDHKLVLRSDGTSVYITQDIGTAELKYQDYNINRSIYVVGNEQDYHFKVLKLILEKLQKSYAKGVYHLSYGMVDLPQGKMKSREGTVVDADDLMQEMYDTAKAKTIELGKTEGMNADQLEILYEKLGMAALKFFLLKVDPKKRMLFNPAESVDFQGDTGPFVLYTVARINSMLTIAGDLDNNSEIKYQLETSEKELLKTILEFENTVKQAAKELNPSVICNYLLEIAKAFNRMYNEVKIAKEEYLPARNLRLMLSKRTSEVIKDGLDLLGIAAVERM